MTKTVLILGAGVDQLISIRIAQSLGYKVIAADSSPKTNPDHVIDIRNENEVWSLALKVKADGIFCHAVEIPDVVAAVCEGLGLPSIKAKVARACTDKITRAHVFKAHGIPSPEFETVESRGVIGKRVRTIGLPCVVKPVYNAGSRGVTKVSLISDAERAYDEAFKHSTGRMVIVEEYLEGPEISTEHVIYNGQIHTTGFADRNYDKKRFLPYFIEDGHTIPSELSQEDQMKVIEVAEKAIRALGVDRGVAKGDLILTKDGPKVLEMACRTSGGRFCSDMVPLATGVQILKPLIQMAVGDEIDLSDLIPKFQRAAAQRFFLPGPGKVTKIDGLPLVDAPIGREHPADIALRLARNRVRETHSISIGVVNPRGLHDIVLNLKVGDEIKPLTNHSDRVGHVICTGETRQEAVERAEAAIAAVRIEVE